ncbi:hypothetical protein EDB84DRAFT_1474260 [Lactarius hengduanensis]|nr:hypothetical protein EDB84DRAFT_1474260 [Lactarius hengduanensis]
MARGIVGQLLVSTIYCLRVARCLADLDDSLSCYFFYCKEFPLIHVYISLTCSFPAVFLFCPSRHLMATTRLLLLRSLHASHIYCKMVPIKVSVENRTLVYDNQ